MLAKIDVLLLNILSLLCFGALIALQVIEATDLFGSVMALMP